MNYFSNYNYALISTVLLLYITKRQISGKAIAKLYGTNQRYLEKGLQTLSKAKILIGERGPSGGYKLLANGKILSIYKVLNAVNNSNKTEVSRISITKHLESKASSFFKSITINELTDNFSEKEIKYFNNLALPSTRNRKYNLLNKQKRIPNVSSINRTPSQINILSTEIHQSNLSDNNIISSQVNHNTKASPIGPADSFSERNKSINQSSVSKNTNFSIRKAMIKVFKK